MLCLFFFVCLTTVVSSVHQLVRGDVQDFAEFQCVFEGHLPYVRFAPFNKANPALNTMVTAGNKLSYAPKDAEKRPTEVFCDIHPWMKSYFFIVDHPFATVTQSDGTFEIKDVPAGTPMLVVWQSAVGYASEGGNKGMSVTVKAGEATDVGDVKITKAPK